MFINQREGVPQTKNSVLLRENTHERGFSFILFVHKEKAAVVEENG